MPDSASTNLRQQALEAFARRASGCAPMISQALRDAPNDGELLLADAAVKAEQGLDEPFARLEKILEIDPGWVPGHRRLAQLKVEFGIGDPLAKIERALSLRADDPRLWHCYLVLLSSLERNLEAAEKTAALRRHVGDVPALRLLEARFAGLAGHAADGARLLEGLPSDVPDLDYQRIRNALQRGDPEYAVQLFEQTDPGSDMRLWAMAELCWRAVGDERHEWLMGNGAVIGAFDIGLTEQELSELCDCLRSLHQSKIAPPSQSLRNGTQTRGNLHLREEAALIPLFAGFDAALDAFSKSLSAIAKDHPLFVLRSRFLSIVASWSVRLAEGGFHVPHMHSEGLLSSACHLIVPETGGSRDGALELGRPPKDIDLDIGPFVEFMPQPCRLIVFPSFLYHSTTPFGAGERLTAVFDAA